VVDSKNAAGFERRTLIDAGICPYSIEETVMTALRQRMLDALILRGLAPRTSG
jgi:hypothetical protein